MNNVFCYICNKTIDVELVTGKEIYPHRKDLYPLKFYQCQFCQGYVGVHKGTLKPLGYIVSNKIKKARMKIHDIIDPIWKNKKMKRKEVYKKISNHIGKKFHTAEIKTIDEADEILKFLQGGL